MDKAREVLVLLRVAVASSFIVPTGSCLCPHLTYA